MFFNWILFIGAVGAYFKKGNIENYQKRLTEKQAKISRLSEISVNPESEKYFNNAQLLMGREKMGEMNLFLFSLFYELKHSNKCKNNVAINKPTQMSIIDKIKATVDVSVFGKFLVLEWNSTDLDHPERGLLSEKLRETKNENLIEKTIRRMRGIEKYSNLIVPLREQRWPQGHALHTVELESEFEVTKLNSPKGENLEKATTSQ